LPAKTPIETSGIVQVLWADDFENRHVTQLYYLEEMGTGRRFTLRFSEPVAPSLRSGTSVRVRGTLHAQEIQVAPLGGAAGGLEYVGDAGPLVSGSQLTIVILVNFTNATIGCSVATVSNAVFSLTQSSVNQVYLETSFSNLVWSGIAVGPYTINYGSGVCDPLGWAAAADAAAIASGVDLSLCAHKVYALPTAGACGWGGLGTIGGNPSQAWVASCNTIFQYAHEMGHNLGMYHSSTDPDNDAVIELEYGDSSDFMSACYCLTRLNGPHMVQMGWAATNETQALSAPGTYQVAPLEWGSTGTTLPQILTFAIPNTSESYYVSYRQPLGLDANLSSAYTPGVCIHRWCCGNTRLIATLTDGMSFSDTNGFTLRQKSHTLTSATLTFGSSEAVPPPPPIFTAISPAANGRFNLSGAGVPGHVYYLHAATNLSSPVFWTLIGTNTADTNGAFSFSDLQATNYRLRFYRLEAAQ
jgi:hypothetical protein